MNHRVLAGILSVSVLLAIAFGFLFLNSQSNLACSYFTCWSSYYFVDVVYPLTKNIWPLAVLFFALIFVKKVVFFSWLILFLPFAVVGFLLVINSATIPGGWYPQMFPNRQEMTRLVVNLLVGGSAAFLAINYVQLYRRKRIKSATGFKHNSPEEGE